MYAIQLLDHISPKGLSFFLPERYQLNADLVNPDAILVRSHKLHHHEFASNLKAVARAGTGTDNIPVELLTQMGVPVFYAPGANANAVKELVMAAMLMGYRNLSETRTFIHALSKENNQILNQAIESQKKQFVGQEIFGKTLGVIGLGNIGVKVANAACALGMRVVAYDPLLTLTNALALMPNIEKMTDLHALLACADIITLHVPLNAETTHLINEKNIGLCKPNMLLLNFSRECVVSEAAILEHLSHKKMMGYITDFPTINLIKQPQVLCFPHLGASTLEAEQSAAEMVIYNLCHYLERGVIEYSINFPNISLAAPLISDCQRILYINQNTPGVMGKITQKISQLGCNIEQMENKSRETIAVSLIDISGTKSSSAEINAQLKAIPGVIQVRLIPFS